MVVTKEYLKQCQQRQYKNKVDLSEDFLIIEYIEKQKSCAQIGRENGYPTQTIWRYLKKYNIEIRSQGFYRANTARNLENKKFGKLFVIKRTPSKSTKDRWLAKCDCGKETTTIGHYLVHNEEPMCFDCACPKSGTNIILGEAWRTIKSSAMDRNIIFELTIQEAEEIFLQQNGKCALTGWDIKFAKTKKDHNKNRLTTASLDRKDNTKPYSKNNCQWVHKDINRMKWAFDEEKFIKMCEAVTNYKRTEIINV